MAFATQNGSSPIYTGVTGTIHFQRDVSFNLIISFFEGEGGIIDKIITYVEIDGDKMLTKIFKLLGFEKTIDQISLIGKRFRLSGVVKTIHVIDFVLWGLLNHTI